MVAIVTGTGLGLDRSSAQVLGKVGQQGQLGDSTFNRYGENVTVNAATGNLMIERTDEILIGRGPDDVISHDYNSLSANQGYGAQHSWQFNDARCITGLTGGTGVSTLGSQVTRIDSDGSDDLYTWDTTANAYVCHQGGNAEYLLTFNTSTNVWTWKDPAAGVTETYDGTQGGRIKSASDNYGNVLTYNYNSTSGLLASVQTTDDTGHTTELTTFNWTDAFHLQIDTSHDGSATTTRTYYFYDSSHRLRTVTTDLSPDDGSTSDNAKVATTYTYDGSSDRVTKITQTGLAELDIGYTQGSDGIYRVTSLTETVSATWGIYRTTGITYNPGVTSVTDTNGQITTINYDSKGQLTSLILPPAQTGAARQGWSYGYNANGDVTSVTDPLLNVTRYDYDGSDNLTKVTDPYGNFVSYTYDTTLSLTKNHVLTETHTPGSGQPGSIWTKRYAYNTNGSLRYVVTGDGGVSEFQYNGFGQRTYSITYRDSTYDVSHLASTAAIAESDLNTWVGAIVDKSTILRTDYHYDFRGNIDWEKTYAACNTAGTGYTNQTYEQINYVYDQFGNLLQRQTNGATNIEHFQYDGLGRCTSSVDLNGGTTTFQWTDGSNNCLVTLANGLTKSTSYYRNGDLYYYTVAGDSYFQTEGTWYRPNNLGETGAVTDAMAQKSYALYDNVGRKVADIAADGSMTEYRYDANNNLIATIGYAKLVTASKLSLLADANGFPLTVDVSAIRPDTDASDVWSWRLYDHDNRLIETIAGDGGATVYKYDSDSNLIQTTSYYAKLNASGFTSNLPTGPSPLLPGTTAGKDDTTKNYYDYEGRLVATLNGDGYLNQTVYNQAGQTVETISFANVVTGATDSLATIIANLATSDSDAHTHFVYDDRGLLRYTIDAKMRPTEYRYDAVGRQIGKIDFATSITAPTAYTVSLVQTNIIVNVASDRRSWSVFDTQTGNLDYAIAADGGVTRHEYDNQHMGTVVKTTQFVTPHSTSSLPSQDDMDNTWVPGNSNPDDRITRTIYDLDGRLVYTVDAESYVTEYQYDKDDRRTLQIRYAEHYAVSDGDGQAELHTDLLQALLSNAVQTKYLYDVDGRLQDTIDDFGGLAIDTRLAYDGIGRVTDKTVAYGTPDAAITHYDYDTAGRLKDEIQDDTSTGVQATTLYSYDGMGNILTITDPNSNITTYTYDALGQVLSKKDALNNITSYTYEAFGNRLTQTDPLNNVTYYAYDLLNRLTTETDPLGNQTTTAYTIGGAIASITRNGATTTFTRDKLDRVTKVTDALGYYESYTLDAFGDRLTVRNKLGGTTNNTFDGRGLLISEVLPRAAYDGDNNLLATTVKNTYSYDARGNRTTMIEAVGLPLPRTTTYGYDHLDRLISTKGDSVSAVSDTNLNSTSSVTPTTTLVYDKRGNVIESDDAAGARTLFYYDDLNRKISEVNALGALSAWTYDDNGNMKSARVYTANVDLPVNPGGTPPNPAQNDTTYRETTYQYDAINRLTVTTVANLLTGSYGSSYTTTTGDVTTTNRYDKAINALRQFDGRNRCVWTYYDALGRKIAEIDQDNYLTKYDLDANGNVLTETRYANAASGMSDTAQFSDIVITTDNVADRVTNFTYDLNGNRLTEERLHVVAWVINSSTGAKTADSHTTAKITYTYNGLGEVASKVEATGDSTVYTYNSAGQQISVDLISPGSATQQHTGERYDGLGNLALTNVYDYLASPLVFHYTHYYYGAGGRLLSTKDAQGFVRNYAYDAAGRTVLVSYDRVHSNGTTKTTEGDFTQYDKLGRATLQGTATKSGSTWSLNDTAGTQYNMFGEVSARSVNNIVQQTFFYDNGGRMWKSTDEGIVTLYLYDAKGEQTLAVTTDGNALPSGDWNSLSINDAITLMTANGAIGSLAQGMVETITLYTYNGQAKQTRQPQRQLSVNSSGVYTTATIVSSRTYNAFGEVTSETDGNGNTTTYSYSTLGKVIQEVLPAVSTTDEHNNTTTANPTLNNFYDISGRLVAVQDANGTLNNKVNTRTLLGNTGYDGSDALVSQEFHADTGHVVNTYDVWNDLIEAADSVGVTDYTYDMVGNRLTEIHPLSDDGVTRLTDTYTYDGLGQRLKHTNSFYQDSNGNPTAYETTDYDAEGRVSQTVDMDGHATNYGYAWHPETSTTGLGIYGGWTKTTGNTAGLTETESSDADGRTVAKTDFGGNVYGYTYDRAGRLVMRTDSYIPAGSMGGQFQYPSGEAMTYSYFNTGLKALAASSYAYVTREIDDGQFIYYGDYDVIQADYAYDKNGNEVFEDSIHGVDDELNGTLTATLTERETATFDALNRLTALSDTGITQTGTVLGLGTLTIANGVDDPMTIAIKYDLNGNVRNRHSTYYLLNDNGTVSTTQTPQDDWYRYDAMNRFVTTKGTLSGTNIIGGTAITYDGAGNRRTATTSSETDTYIYSADGYLKETDIALSSGTEKATYDRDLMGRVVHYEERNTSNSVVYSKDTTYNEIGQDTYDYTTTVRSDGTFHWATTYDYKNYGTGGYNGSYAGGSVTHLSSVETGSATATTDSAYSYIWFDGAQESSELYKPNPNTTYSSSLRYDQRQDLDEAIINDGVYRDVFYQQSIDGQIVQRDTANVTNAPHARYYFFGGIQMGDISNDGTSDVDYATSITDHKTKPGTGFFQNGATTGTHYADFDASYSPINGLTYQQSASAWTVQDGDTLQSIAQAVWGDSNFWYVIADANGLDSSSTLVAGQSLIIPNKVENSQNNSSTYRVYDPNDAIGNISPTAIPVNLDKGEMHRAYP